MSQRVLVLFAHPAVRSSRVQVALAAAARAVPGVTVHDLYEAYPDLDIDIEAEQQLLTSHDVIVLQFPFYWYSVPPIIKQWFDLVLEHGWAYGSQGTALAGKRGGVAMSTGGREAAYQPDGYNRYTFDDFLRPVESTMRLCRMEWLPPFVVAGSHAITPAELVDEATRYEAWLTALRDATLEPR